MTRQLENIHLFSIKGEYAFFDKNTFALSSLNELSFKVISMIQEGKSILEVSMQTGISVNDIENFVSHLDTKVSLGESMQEVGEKPTISRITLHISNDCNLRCKYCYASGGSYQTKRGLMSEQTAKQVVEFCIETFAKIENIVFFGGEPFLNPHIIEYVCEEFLRLYQAHIIDYLPNFGAITNGMLYSEKTIGLIERYFSFLTISIDGPKDINDLNRVDRFGKGSYEHIRQFISKVKVLPKLSLRYEATFTKQHMDMGYTHQKLKGFFLSEFGLEGDVVTEHNLEKKIAQTQSYKIKEGEYDATFWSILSAIVGKQSKSMCALYRKTLAISVEGEIFPCHMNAGEKECSLGNINDSNIYNDKAAFIKKQPGLGNKFKDNSVCNKCWANKICGGCSRLWFYDEEKHKYNLHPDVKLCQTNNRYLEEILFQIIHLRKNPQKWNEFIDKLKKYK